MTTLRSYVWVDPPTLDVGASAPNRHPTPAAALAALLDALPPELHVEPFTLYLYVDKQTLGPFTPAAAAAWLRDAAPTIDGVVVPLEATFPIELPPGVDAFELVGYPDDEPVQAVGLTPLGEGEGGWGRFLPANVPTVKLEIVVDVDEAWVNAGSRLELWHPTTFDGLANEVCARNNARLHQLLQEWIDTLG